MQIAAHYLFEFPRLDKRPFGLGTHVIASEAEGRIGIRMAGSVLLFETLADQLGESVPVLRACKGELCNDPARDGGFG